MQAQGRSRTAAAAAASTAALAVPPLGASQHLQPALPCGCCAGVDGPGGGGLLLGTREEQLDVLAR